MYDDRHAISAFIQQGAAPQTSIEVAMRLLNLNLRLLPLLAVACAATLSCSQRSDTPSAPSAAKARTASSPSTTLPPESTGRAPAGKPSTKFVVTAEGASGTHCSAGERTIFSCRLANDARVASLCIASSNDAAGVARYASGPMGAPDTLITSAGAASGNARFERTPLVYAGGTGGYAYSVERSGQVHVLYSISGEDHLERQGEMVMAANDLSAISDTPCISGTIIESDDIDVLRQVRDWPARPRLESQGLPSISN